MKRDITANPAYEVNVTLIPKPMKKTRKENKGMQIEQEGRKSTLQMTRLSKI